MPRGELVSFCTREYPRLVGTVHGLLGDRQAAEDVAQEALLRTWSSWDAVRDLDQPGAWSRRVALRLAVSDHRRRAAHDRALARLGPAPSVVTVEERAERADTARHLRAAVDELPDPLRRAVTLHYFGGHPVREVAALLGRPEGTVKSDLYRARRLLRAALAAAATLALIAAIAMGVSARQLPVPVIDTVPAGPAPPSVEVERWVLPAVGIELSVPASWTADTGHPMALQATNGALSVQLGAPVRDILDACWAVADRTPGAGDSVLRLVRLGENRGCLWAARDGSAAALAVAMPTVTGMPMTVLVEGDPADLRTLVQLGAR